MQTIYSGEIEESQALQDIGRREENEEYMWRHSIYVQENIDDAFVVLSLVRIVAVVCVVGMVSYLYSFCT